VRAARPALGVPAARDEAGALEHLEVPRNRGKADLERLGQLGHRRLAIGQAREDCEAHGIGEGGEGPTHFSVGSQHLTLSLINLNVK
jgi:hypothetical protein